MTRSQGITWQGEMDFVHLELLRRAVPAAIHRAQLRSAAAHEAYGDRDGDRFVYGVGIGRGAQKELADELQTDSDFRTEQVPGSRRALLFLGRYLLFLHRVGPRMPLDPARIRLDYLPEPRRQVLHDASVRRFDAPALFADNTSEDGPAVLHDVARRLGARIDGEALLVACYSSTPHSIGRIYLAPAKLVDGHYLQLIDPEELHYRRLPDARAVAAPSTRAKSFSDGSRPRTTARLRPTPPRQNGS